jgi:antitoxin CptB
MKGPDRIRRLRWLCRRGMKELDVLLSRFVQGHANDLEDGAWPEFEQLLTYEDDVLWDCLQNPASAQSAPHARLLRTIRDDAPPTA